MASRQKKSAGEGDEQSKTLEFRQKGAENLKGSLIIEKDEWLTTEEAADYLRLSVGSLRNLTSDGWITHCKLGRRNRYLKAELKKLLLDEIRRRRKND